jgi:hypothetical protein
MSARLEGHHARRAGGIIAAVEGVDFGMRPAKLGVVPLPDHLTVTEQYRAYQRVRRDPAPSFQGKLNRPVHRFEFSHDLLLNIEYPIMNIE